MVRLYFRGNENLKTKQNMKTFTPTLIMLLPMHGQEQKQDTAKEAPKQKRQSPKKGHEFHQDARSRLIGLRG
jgi:hypothetical protein